MVETKVTPITLKQINRMIINDDVDAQIIPCQNIDEKGNPCEYLSTDPNDTWGIGACRLSGNIIENGICKVKNRPITIVNLAKVQQKYQYNKQNCLQSLQGNKNLFE